MDGNGAHYNIMNMDVVLVDATNIALMTILPTGLLVCYLGPGDTNLLSHQISNTVTALR
jgi:hypothetical protein